MKKILASLLAMLLATSIISGCSPTSNNKVIIPDITGADEMSAKTVLLNNGLIPIIEYEYNSKARQGNVIKIEPEAGTSVDPNSRVIIYVCAAKPTSKPSTTTTTTTTRKKTTTTSVKSAVGIYRYDFIENGDSQCETLELKKGGSVVYEYFVENYGSEWVTIHGTWKQSGNTICLNLEHKENHDIGYEFVGGKSEATLTDNGIVLWQTLYKRIN